MMIAPHFHLPSSFQTRLSMPRYRPGPEATPYPISPVSFVSQSGHILMQKIDKHAQVRQPSYFYSVDLFLTCSLRCPFPAKPTCGLPPPITHPRPSLRTSRTGQARPAIQVRYPAAEPYSYLIHIQNPHLRSESQTTIPSCPKIDDHRPWLSLASTRASTSIPSYPSIPSPNEVAHLSHDPFIN